MSFSPLLLILLAHATPYRVVVDGPLDPDAHDALLEAAAGQAPPGTTHVEIAVRGPDGALRPAEALLPRPAPSPVKPAERAARRATSGVDLPGESEGALSGRAVYLSQCHGWLWYDSLDDFSTQRGNLYDTVEDFHNPEGANQFLARMLENAGARVYTARERDMQVESAFVDDGDAGYEEVGSGFSNGGSGWGDASPWAYGVNPFESGDTRRFPANDTAVARWTPDVPADGWYAVYVAWDSASDNAPDARYRLTHAGGVIERTFDQTVHGSTWQYVDTLWLPEGEGGLTIELGGASRAAAAKLSADAVRIGGGRGDVERYGAPTDRPRWEDGGILYTQYNGAPTSVYDPYADGNGSDPSSRSRWAAWEHPAGEDAVYLSWHSNAGGGTGTSTYTYEGDSGPAVEGSEELGELLNAELVDAFQSMWDPDWRDRGHLTAAFSEVSPYHNDEMPAALVELAFHDNAYDVELLKDPRFRLDAARAMTRALIRYFAERDGTRAVYPPEAPLGLAVRHRSDGQLEASWWAGPDGYPYGDTASAYLVETSADGRSWSSPTEVTGRSLTLDTAPGETVYVRVSARNTGGSSFPTEVMGARRSPDGRAPVLIVSAFDRFEGSLLPWESVDFGVGDVRRMDLRRVNPFDVVVAHGEAIAAAGWPFESASDERYVDELDGAGHALVIWAAGEESTSDETIDAAQQASLRAHVQGGGALWASGAEILWDLDYRGDAADQSFAQDVLGAGLDDDDAGTTRVAGEGLLDGWLLDFGEEDGGAYPVEYPDVLATDRTVIARYASGGAAAALGERVAIFGFPFETIGDPEARAGVAAALLPALVPDYTPPEVDTGSQDSGTGDSGDDGIGGAGDGAQPGDEAGCGGCASGSGAGSWLLAGAGAWMARRRRAEARSGGRA